MQLVPFKTDNDLAQAVATAWLELIATAQREQKSHCVALSGGRITLKFFAAVIAQSKAQGLTLHNVDFFWADERCVPPNDAESSFAAADKSFFQPLGIATDKIHRIHGEEAPEFAARQAEAELCRIAPLNDDGQPMLDLIFLGMGEDGHVASLFPSESESMIADKRVYRTITNSPKPPPNRVTLGYQTIAAAKAVWVLASGAGKETALRESLRPDGNTPLGRVFRLSPQAKLFSDIPAS